MRAPSPRRRRIRRAGVVCAEQHGHVANRRDAGDRNQGRSRTIASTTSTSSAGGEPDASSGSLISLRESAPAGSLRCQPESGLPVRRRNVIRAKCQVVTGGIEVDRVECLCRLVFDALNRGETVETGCHRILRDVELALDFDVALRT